MRYDPAPTAARRRGAPTETPGVRGRRLTVVLAALGALTLPPAALPAATAAPVLQGTIPSAAPSALTPNVGNGHVEEITQAGGKTLLGGDFTTVTSAGSTTALTRNRLLAFDATGTVDPDFAPDLNGQVNALLPGPVADTVYVGGKSTTLSGAPVRRLLLLSTTTGAPVPGFVAPVMNGVVNDVKRIGDRLYVGGTFTKVDGVTHSGLVTLNATTGGLDPFLNIQVAGHHNWTTSSPVGDAKGPVGVLKLDVNPAGSRLVAVGNFKTVNGTDRDQVFQADLTGTAASLAAWQTNRYDPRCLANFHDSWARDVDFSPDGAYFVVASTGGYPGFDLLCDTAARWETAATGSDLQPSWVDATGGDTLLSVAVTDAAVYVGGHQRWLNNPYADNVAGPGAVPRPGLGALDPTTGVPLAWNPGRNPRGTGAAALYVAPDGLYVGSDTGSIGVGKTKVVRKRIALFPLAGGRARAGDATPVLPGTVVQTAGRYNVLHRINEGGPTLPAVDAGPVWTGDDTPDAPALRNSGSSIASYGPVPRLASLPPGTPAGLFGSERWDPVGGEEMQFHLAVPKATPLTVRLYFASRCTCTSTVGSRTFNVSLDGTTVLRGYDVVAKVGDQTGTYEEFSVPGEADGSVDLMFGHVVEQPIVDGIEVLDASRPGVPPAGAGSDALTSRSFDGKTAGTPSTGTASTVAWRNGRGGFVAGGALYYGSTVDATIHRRALDGSSDVALNPYHDPIWENVNNGSGGTYAGNVPDLYASLDSVTSMFYAKGRLYYTLQGSRTLYGRFFSTDSGILGAQAFVADTTRDWSDTTGAFLSGGLLYLARADGNLYSLGWSDAPAVTGQPVAGRPTSSPALVSSTGDWGGRAMWLVPG